LRWRKVEPADPLRDRKAFEHLHLYDVHQHRRRSVSSTYSHTRERSQKKPRHSLTKSRSSDKSLPPETTPVIGSLL
jgi:hypothetical protein